MIVEAPFVSVANSEDRVSLLRAIRILDEVPVARWDMGILIELHRRLLPPTHPYLGQLRTHHGVVRLRGVTQRDFPPISECIRLTNATLRRLSIELEGKKKIDWITIASETMLHLIDAHPFKDGNGRVSRAVATWLLMRGGYILRINPRVYCRENIDTYYQAISRALAGQGEALHRKGDFLSAPDLWFRFFRDMVRVCFIARNEQQVEKQIS